MARKKRNKKQLTIFDEEKPELFSGYCTCTREWSDEYIEALNESQIGEIVWCECENAQFPFAGRIFTKEEKETFIDQKGIDRSKLAKIFPSPYAVNYV